MRTINFNGSKMNKLFKENITYILGGVGVLILFCLSFIHLTILPVFADEAIYIRWAQVMKAEETLRFFHFLTAKNLYLCGLPWFSLK